MVLEGFLGAEPVVFVDAGVAQVGVVAYLCGGFGDDGGLEEEVERGLRAVVEDLCDEPGGVVGDDGFTGRQVVEGEVVAVHIVGSC